MRRSALLVLVLLLALPFLAHAAKTDILTDNPSGQWVPTGEAGCSNGEICVQWCHLVAGQEVPSGSFCCLPEKLAHSRDFGACEAVRE